ncbi:TRAP transporter large permease [Parahaliea mediterranea]|uniref:TRAP transporter large permease n=1 Tax=Parahaliea mediterranea TaxID=651086 RepID=UPI000E2E9B76|nr:TRAP transporter large permease [Parahaliea mediterranea]
MTIALFLLLLLAGVPIAVCLGLVTATYIVVSGNTVLLQSYALQQFAAVESYGLLAIPLFMLVGELMNGAGITPRLVRAASVMVGQVRGGLAFVNLLANSLVAAIIGSAAAQIAVMSRTMTPAMKAQGYSPAFAAATTAAGGLLSPIIPPSMLLVIYGVLAQLSIADLFIAGILPGLLLLFAFLATLGVLSRRLDLPRGDALKGQDRRTRLREGLVPALVPCIIIASITLGLATPTEAAALAAAAAWALGRFYYRELDRRALWQALLRASTGAALILFVIATAGLLSWVLLFEQIPQQLAAGITGLTQNPFYFLLLVNLALLLVGALLDGIPAMIMLVPILLPIAATQYGIDPYQFGIILSLNLVLGLLTPPVGTGLYIAAEAAQIGPGRVFQAVLPFLLAATLVLVLLSWQPGVITALH